MPHAPRHPPTDNPYNISIRTDYPIHTYKALHLVIFSIPIIFSPLKPKYSPQHPLLKSLDNTSFIQHDSFFRLCTATAKISHLL